MYVHLFFPFPRTVPSLPSSSSNFQRDAHVPELLLFSPKKAFHDDVAYKSGKLILQDKASCFPPLVLNPPASTKATVIDATAAPGNKTTYLSALMGNKGKVCKLVVIRWGNADDACISCSPLSATSGASRR